MDISLSDVVIGQYHTYLSISQQVACSIVLVVRYYVGVIDASPDDKGCNGAGL